MGSSGKVQRGGFGCLLDRISGLDGVAACGRSNRSNGRVIVFWSDPIFWVRLFTLSLWLILGYYVDAGQMHWQSIKSKRED